MDACPEGLLNRNTIIVATNPNWGRATAYQAVRQFRFALRVTF